MKLKEEQRIVAVAKSVGLTPFPVIQIPEPDNDYQYPSLTYSEEAEGVVRTMQGNYRSRNFSITVSDPVRGTAILFLTKFLDSIAGELDEISMDGEDYDLTHRVFQRYATISF